MAADGCGECGEAASQGGDFFGDRGNGFVGGGQAVLLNNFLKYLVSVNHGSRYSQSLSVCSDGDVLSGHGQVDAGTFDVVQRGCHGVVSCVLAIRDSSRAMSLW